MNTVHRTAYNIAQREGRLNRMIVHYAKRIAEIGEPTTPTQKRAMTLAVKCLKRNVRDLDKVKALKPTTKVSS